MLTWHTLPHTVPTCNTNYKYRVTVLIVMPQVTVSVRMKLVLNEIRDDEGHTSVDSVLRSLLITSGYKSLLKGSVVHD